MLERIGPYTVVREMAQDRFGQVFEALDPARRKRVILKALRHDAASRPEIASRLYSRAQTLALLNHPHIARLFGFIRANDKLYLVMEFVEGESLQSILQQKGRLHPNLALAIFQQIISGVKFAHDLGVIHGDLKPSNVMVSNFAQIKVLDFAIAPILGNLHLEDRGGSSAPYLAPEQLRGEPADICSDVYSLAVLLYQSITGSLPFRPDAASAGPMTPASALVPDCPKWLDGFLLRALAASPAERYQSIAAMGRAMGPADQPGKMSPEALRVFAKALARRISASAAILVAATRTTSSRLAPRINGAVAALRRMPSTVITGLEKERTSIEPWMRARITALRRQWRSHRGELGASLASLLRAVDQQLTRQAGGLMSSHWKTYSIIAALLVSLGIEIFIFRGVNTSGNSEVNSIPVAVLDQSGAARTIVEPLGPEPAPPVEIVSGPEPQPQAVNRGKRNARAAERAQGVDNLHHHALNSKRTVTYRTDSESHFKRPVVQEARKLEPAARGPENTATKLQLNVRWEN